MSALSAAVFKTSVENQPDFISNGSRNGHEGERVPLQPKSGNKRPRPDDGEGRQKPKKKKSKKITELETLSDLVEKTETAIYSHHQIRSMPRKQLETAYLSLQDTSTQVLLPANKQNLENYDPAQQQVPEAVLGICNNYIEITAQLMKMVEKAEEEKQHLQHTLDKAEEENKRLQGKVEKSARRNDHLQNERDKYERQLSKATVEVKDFQDYMARVRPFGAQGDLLELAKACLKTLDEKGFQTSGHEQEPEEARTERLRICTELNVHIEHLYESVRQRDAWMAVKMEKDKGEK